MQNNADFRDLNEEYLGSQNRFKRVLHLKSYSVTL